MDEDALRKIDALFENEEEMVQALLNLVEARYGAVPLVARVLSQYPHLFIPYVIKGSQVLGAPRALGPKVAELVAIASATALRCNHCTRTHIESALAQGATADEVLETIAVASMIAESSSLSVALREFRQVEAKHNKAHSSPKPDL